MSPPSSPTVSPNLDSNSEYITVTISNGSGNYTITAVTPYGTNNLSPINNTVTIPTIINYTLVFGNYSVTVNDNYYNTSGSARIVVYPSTLAIQFTDNSGNLYVPSEIVKFQTGIQLTATVGNQSNINIPLTEMSLDWYKGISMIEEQVNTININKPGIYQAVAIVDNVQATATIAYSI